MFLLKKKGSIVRLYHRIMRNCGVVVDFAVDIVVGVVIVVNKPRSR